MLKLSNVFMMVGLFGILSGSYVQAEIPTEGSASVTWEQFKEGCLNPAKFNNQIPQQNIRILCTDVKKGFVSTAPGQVPLPAQRRIQFAAYSSKYHVNPEQRDVPVSALTSGSCLKFKEVENMYTLEKTLTCDDIIRDVKMGDDLFSVCLAYLDQTKAGSVSKLVESRDTGRSVDTCSAATMITQ